MHSCVAWIWFFSRTSFHPFTSIEAHLAFIEVKLYLTLLEGRWWWWRNGGKWGWRVHSRPLADDYYYGWCLISSIDSYQREQISDKSTCSWRSVKLTKVVTRCLRSIVTMYVIRRCLVYWAIQLVRFLKFFWSDMEILCFVWILY